VADHRSWLDRFVGLCITLLVAAAAVYIAVKLIEAVWAALLVIAAVGGFIALAVAILRSQNNGW